VTAGNAEADRVREAKAAGEALSASTTEHAEQMHRKISGRATDTRDSERTLPAVDWFGSPGIVSGPTPDNAGQNRSPNISTPTDNHQSQP
jgi:hypothetical protein